MALCSASAGMFPSAPHQHPFLIVFRIVLVFHLLLCVSLTHAQGPITGRVLGATSEGPVPLIGANVYWAGTTTGVATDTEGRFEFAGFGTDAPAFFWPRSPAMAMPPHGPVTIPPEGVDGLVLPTRRGAAGLVTLSMVKPACSSHK